MNMDTLYRAAVLVVLVVSLFISGRYRKQAREDSEIIDRQEEGWLVLSLRMAAGISLLAVIILNIFFPSWMSWSKVNLPEWLRMAGSVLMIAFLPWIWWVFDSIGHNISETTLTKDSHELITSGPYHWVRHPLYAGSLLFLFSISLVLEDWLIFGYAIAGLLAFRLLVIPEEEQQLLESFGEEYECYQSRTGALLPWIR